MPSLPGRARAQAGPAQGLPRDLAGPQDARLSVTQVVALRAISGGKSISAAAEASGVCRSTLYRWLTADPDFAAAYNAWKVELLESGRARILKLSEKAIDTLGNALEEGDARSALTLLKSIGLLAPQSAAPTNAEHLRRHMDLDQRQERLDLANRWDHLKHGSILLEQYDRARLDEESCEKRTAESGPSAVPNPD